MKRPAHFGQNDATDKVPLPAPVTSSDFIRWLQLLQMKMKYLVMMMEIALLIVVCIKFISQFGKIGADYLMKVLV